MQDSLKRFAANENNPKWEDIIKRETAIYHQGGDMRSTFVRDYTRIINSSAYRRLRNKTQVLAIMIIHYPFCFYSFSAFSLLK